MNILISYPKSASDWIRYICEYIYLRPTADKKPKSKLKNIYNVINEEYNMKNE